MTESNYQIVFEGKLTGERPLEEVKRNMAALFKMNAAQVENLFAGKPVVIKKDIDQATASKYQAAFQKAGALCAIVGGNSGTTPAAKPAQPSAAQNRAPAATATPAKTTASGGRRDIVNLKVPQDVSGLSMGEAGEILETLPQQQAAPIPDTSGLTFSNDDNSFLAPTRETPEPKIDLGGLAMEKAE
jgi:ribosomal protein L7/L12